MPKMEDAKLVLMIGPASFKDMFGRGPEQRRTPDTLQDIEGNWWTPSFDAETEVNTWVDGPHGSWTHQVLEKDIFFLRTGIVYVNAYHITREFGGREEGGWWFNHYEPLASVEMANNGFVEVVKKALEKRFEDCNDPQPLYNVHSGGKLVVQIEDTPAERTPQPRYE